MNPLFSIIIPCKEINDYAKECVEYCKQLDYKYYEIILLPNSTSAEIEGVKVISTGPLTPGAKRNIGLSNSIGEICAFIDSDAYPSEDWLHNAKKYFRDPDVAAVGGPGLTPVEDAFMQKAGGFVLSSFMVGNLSKRFKSKRAFESDDIHSCNLIVRRSVLFDVGGWNEKYWPGEDTLLSLNLNKLGKKVLMAPDVVVYHHRRPLFMGHLKQISRFGLHRGFFSKRFPGNSFKLVYFMPSMLILGIIIGGIILFLNEKLMNDVIWVPTLYLLSCLILSLSESRDIRLFLPVWLGIVTTHFVYGVSFLVGLMKRDLER